MEDIQHSKIGKANTLSIIPVKTGIQGPKQREKTSLDPRFRGDVSLLQGRQGWR